MRVPVNQRTWSEGRRTKIVDGVSQGICTLVGTAAFDPNTKQAFGPIFLCQQFLQLVRFSPTELFASCFNV